MMKMNKKKDDKNEKKNDLKIVFLMIVDMIKKKIFDSAKKLNMCEINAKT